VITLRNLVRHLERRGGAWSLVERVQDIAFAGEQPTRQRRDHRTRLSLIVHQDVPRGRGTARLDLDPLDASPVDIVDQAIALALATVGPAWASTPPAAPAKVDLVDPDLIKRELDAVAAGTLARLRRPDGVTLTAAITILREKVTVLAGSGFHATWLATSLRGDAVLTAGDHRLAVSRQARRTDDFDLDAAVAAAAADLALLATAGPPSPGPCALWLGPDALLPGSDADAATATATAAGTPTARDHGLWTIFALQADSTVERQGLTRYRLGTEVARGAAQLAEPLSITSNGALDFAALSVPVTDDAVAIRSFPLIDRGIAIGLGLSPREAALRHTDPNGGVRNLIVAPGTWSPGPAPASGGDPGGGTAPGGRTLELRRLHAVDLDPYTGEATLDIALGLEHRPGRPATPFTGGTIRLDLIAALAHARRSAQLLRRGGYHGPAAILIDDADLIA
jgi:hypothetical protein